jgi:hypothetical protein
MALRASLLTEHAAALAVGNEPRGLRNLAVSALRLCDGAHGQGSAALDRPCVELRAELHPGVRRWLSSAGWDTSADDAKLPPGPGTPAGLAVAELIVGSQAAVPLRGGRRAVFQSGALDVVISRRRIRTDARTQVLTVFDALRWLESTDAALVIVDPEWHRLARLAESAVTFSVDANPARIRLRSQRAETTLTPLVAAARLERDSDVLPVSVSLEAVDLMDMAAAGPASRAGLYPHQDDAVSVLNSSDVGAVLATPPGGGKTVVCAAALDARTWSGRVLVAAPVAVLSQWEDELARWAPQLRSSVARDVERLRRRLADSDVVVTSHDVASRWGMTARTQLALVVLDEAAVLLPRSRRAHGLWRLRTLSERGWALSGTPEERKATDAADLVAWARRRPRGSVPAQAVGAFAPVVTGLAPFGAAPAVRVVAAAVQPTDTDRAWVEQLHRSTGGLTGLAASRARDRARAGLGDPLGAGEQPGGIPAKRAAVVDRLAVHAAAGRSALVFSSSQVAVSAVCALLNDRGAGAAVLDAGLSRSRRVGLLGAFAAGDLPVLGITPASQRGVNLQAADLVVHLDLPASGTEFTQRNARAARIGSVHAEVEVWVPYLADTWDEHWVKAALELGAFDPLAAAVSG